ncbi:MAG: hypothetical protein ACK526_19380 [Planctomyces sp.]
MNNSVCLRRRSLTAEAACFFMFLAVAIFGSALQAAEDAGTLTFEPPDGVKCRGSVVLVAGDEEYRTEESMPMLAKILSRKHGFRSTVVFSMGPDGANYIDPNNQKGLRGLSALKDADLMIIGTRFRQPSEEQAAYVTDYLKSGKPIIGLRTSTHSFQGTQKFGDSLTYSDFGLKILGETWVSHHGQHKVQGARGLPEPGAGDHPILRSVSDVFAPSDVYGVIHLTSADTILMRGAVTASLAPTSPIVQSDINKPMQPLAWLHPYQYSASSAKGTAFCTTAGASVDFVSEDLRRMVINAALHLTGHEVPAKADVEFVDPFYPSFYGFINDPEYWRKADLQVDELGLGKFITMPDAPGSPEWKFRPFPPKK